MIETPRRFRLAEEAFLDVENSSSSSRLLRQGHGLDRHHAVDLWIASLINHAHGALAEFFLDLVTPEHRLLDLTVPKHHRAGVGAATSTTKHHRFRHGLGPREALLEIAEFPVVIGHVPEDGPALLNCRLRSKSSARL